MEKPPYDRFPGVLIGIGVLASVGMYITGSTIMPFLMVVILGGNSGCWGRLKLLSFGYRFLNLRPWEVSAFGVTFANRPSEIGSWSLKYSRKSTCLTGLWFVGLRWCY